MSDWSSPVRYAEVDQQGVVFNSHYLLYCDEAMGAFCLARGLREFVERVRLATSTLTWRGPAHWGDTVEVDVRCTRLGRTSATLSFDIRASGRECCTVETVYVLADLAGGPVPIPDDVRAALTA
ncbi:MAG TPA: thioesterase family protein [Jatrophihabitans sp.]|jgi:acyl-CoA thioester hydrolase|uniref:acyl-CoA thioesterase n=1 Tax=Jatrophihabitans sp. TaxID=1932789 RepID=UPI002DF90A4B|nr:thioesterase family protein [Jatrophihabitans sp.]